MYHQGRRGGGGGGGREGGNSQWRQGIHVPTQVIAKIKKIFPWLWVKIRKIWTSEQNSKLLHGL